jgi:O-acetyl-ADP-ribose deacetylase (regulator of RNase III)
MQRETILSTFFFLRSRIILPHMQIGQTTIEVVRGSVLEQDVDAIVNAANTGMRGGGALDGAVHRAAGPGLLAELIQVAPKGAKTGDPVVTGGHNTPFKYIIHVAGPIFSGANVQEKDSQLASAYSNSLQAAHDRGLESIGFPSISTGVFAFPLDRAAPIALRTAADFVKKHPETPLRRVIFAMFGGEEHEVFRRALGQLKSNL